jgi:hypothetical protein
MAYYHTSKNKKDCPMLSLSTSKLASMFKLVCSSFVALILLSACAPEVGSDAWCKQMEDKPKGDWTVNEAGDYAKHCVFK